MTGIAFGWSAPTSAFGSVVRKPNKSFVVSPSRTFRTDVQRVQMAAKQASGRLSSNANHAGGLDPFGCGSGSEKLVNGTRHRLSGPSHRRHCGDFVLRMLIGTVGWDEQQRRAGGPKCLAYALDFVRTKVVRDDDVAVF